MVVVESATQLSRLLFFPFLRLCRFLSLTFFPLNARRSLALPSSLSSIPSQIIALSTFNLCITAISQ